MDANNRIVCDIEIYSLCEHLRGTRESLRISLLPVAGSHFFDILPHVGAVGKHGHNVRNRKPPLVVVDGFPDLLSLEDRDVVSFIAAPASVLVLCAAC